MLAEIRFEDVEDPSMVVAGLSHGLQLATRIGEILFHGD
jgi:hypothetical protein